MVFKIVVRDFMISISLSTLLFMFDMRPISAKADKEDSIPPFFSSLTNITEATLYLGVVYRRYINELGIAIDKLKKKPRPIIKIFVKLFLDVYLVVFLFPIGIKFIFFHLNDFL